jgi:hypothetical protein
LASIYFQCCHFKFSTASCLKTDVGFAATTFTLLKSTLSLDVCMTFRKSLLISQGHTRFL